MASPLRGLALAGTTYTDAVWPLIGVPHTACLIGEGSEVLGFDTDRSTDHEWGPRLQVFVDDGDVAAVRDRVDLGLPAEIAGHPTRWFSLDSGGVDHHIEVGTVEEWMARRLPTLLLQEPDVAAWLAAPQQHLLQLTGGEVFHDDLGVLTGLRERWAWYPDEVWRWMIACQWHRIGTTEPLLGRVVELGDARGASILTAKLCRLIMEMGYLQRRRYRPYEKWFGVGFTALSDVTDLGAHLDAALAEPIAARAVDAMGRALLDLAYEHNRLGITARVEPVLGDFEVGIGGAVRPYRVLNSGAFIDATIASLGDSPLARLPRVGAIDQLTDPDDLLLNFTTWPAELATVYREMLGRASA